MSNTIDSRVVELEFDNKRFEQNVATSMSTLDKLKEKLHFKGATKGLEELDGAVENVNMGGLGAAVETVTERFSALKVMAVGALMNIGSRAVDAGEKLIKSLSVDQLSAGWEKFASKTSSVQTILNATKDQGETIDTVSDALERLNWFTDETSYNFTDMVSNVGKFTNNKVPLNDAIDAMQGIATWAGISGANVNEASRAMYNMSQAIGVGAVKLMDWKSIENANMATSGFKETAIETAVALGTLTKVSEGVYKTTKGNTVTVQDFNSSLSDAWFTSEVLLKTLNKYGGAATKLQEVMEGLSLDTTSELLDFLDEYQKGTLKIDEAAKEAGVSAEEFKGILEELSGEEYKLGIEAFRAAQEAKTFAEAIDATKDAVSTGWMQTFEHIFGNYEEAKKLWTDLANELWEVFNGGAEARNKLFAGWHDAGGRDSLINSFWNVFHALTGIIDTVKEAFHDIFPATTVDRLVEITKKIESFTEKLKMSEETTAKLRSTFKGVFAVLGIVKEAVTAVLGGIKPLIDIFSKASGGLLTVTGSTGEWLEKLHETIKETGVFKDAVGKVVDFLAGVAERIKSIFNSIKNSFIGDAFSQITDKLTEIKNKMAGIFPTGDEEEPPKKRKSIRGFAQGEESVEGRSTRLGNVLNRVSKSIRGFPQAEEEAIDSSDRLSKTIDRVVKSVRGFPQAGESAADAAGVLTDSLDETEKSLGKQKGLFSGLLSSGKKLAPVFENLASGLSECAESFSNGWNVDSITSFLETLRNNARKIGGDIVNVFFEIAKGVLDGSVSFLETLPEKLGAIGRSIAAALFSVIRQALDELVSFLESLKEKASTISGNLVSILTQTIKGISDNLPELIDACFDFVVQLMDGLADALANNTPRLKAAVIKLLSAVWDAAGEFVKDIDVNDVLSILETTVFAKLGLSLEKFFDSKAAQNAKKGAGGLKGIISKFTDGIKALTEGISDAVDTFKKSTKIKDVKNIAIAIGILSVSLLILSKIDQENLPSALAAMTALIGSLVITAKLLRKNRSNLETFSSSMLKISFGLLMYAVAVRIIGGLETKQTLLATGSMLAYIAAVVAAAKILKKNKSNLDTFSSSMLKISAGLVLYAVAVRIIGGLDTLSTLVATGSILAFLAAIVVVAKLLKKNKSNLEAFSSSMLKISAGLVLYAVAVRIIGGLDAQNALVATGSILAFLAAMVVIAKLLKKNKSDLDSFSANVLKISAGLVLYAVAVRIIGGLDWQNTLVATGSILAFLAAIVVVSKLLKKNKSNLDAFSSGLIKISLGLVLYAAAVKIIGGLSWQQALVAVGSIVVFLGAVVAAAIILKKNRSSLSSFGPALIAISAALLLFSVSMRVIGGMKISQVIVAIVSIAAAFAILVVAAKLASSVTPAILALAGAFALLGLGVAGIGAGIFLIASGIGVLAATGSAGIAILVAAIVALLALVPRIAVAFGKGLVILIKTLGNAAPEIAGALVKLVVAGITALKETVPLVVETILYLIDELLKSLAAHMDSFVESGISIVLSLLKGIEENIGEVVSTLLGIVTEVLNGIAEKIPDLIDAGVSIVIALIDGISQAIENNSLRLRQAIGRLMASIWNGAIAFFTGKEPKNVGENLDDGLAEGVKAGAPKVNRAVTVLGDGAADSLRDSVGVRSPSTVFAEIGKNMDLGLAKGLEQYAYRVTTASESVGEDAVAAARKPLDQFGFDDRLSTTMTITPVLDMTNFDSQSAGLYRTLDDMRLGTSLSLAAANADGMRRRSAVQNDKDGIDKLTGMIKNLIDNPPSVNHNQFNITNGDPDEVAEKVSQKLQRDIVRRNAVWS